MFSLWERQFINVQRGSSFGIKGRLEWSFQNTWTLEKVIHKTAFYKNVTQEVGNYHLKRLPVIPITTLFAEGVQRGSAGERCCRNEGPDRPLVLCPTWRTITPQVVLLRAPGLRASAVNRPSPSCLHCEVCRNTCAILFILSSLVYYSFFFVFAGTQLFIFSAKISIFISWKYLILLTLCREEESMLLFFTILCLVDTECLLYIIFSLPRRSFHLFITACGSLIISIALLMFSKSFE